MPTCTDFRVALADIDAGYLLSLSSKTVYYTRVHRYVYLKMVITYNGSRKPYFQSGSNLLAINAALAPPVDSGGFVNRRLLQQHFSPAAAAATDADVVVAKDGSGDYWTISEAVAAAAARRKRGSDGARRFVIYVKEGVYDENVRVTYDVPNLVMIGDGVDRTVVTGSRSVGDGSTTYSSATFSVAGDGFIARGITFENTAGPQMYQAVAACVESDLAVFYQCSFRGYQDTLYVFSRRQFYRECDIYGTIDFVFGDAAAILQSCNLYIRRPLDGQMNSVTAQGRSDPNENTGIIVHGSVVAAAADLRAVSGAFKSYLGRPWGSYSRTVFMKTSMDGSIDPAGWLPWSGSFGLNTLYYGEYLNSGVGADTSRRVRWPGYHVMSTVEALQFAVGTFVAGGAWIVGAGVPVTLGL
ncbi:pectinesterase-like [Ananas comosus]|uniref:Pectinesterase n=1 Tax=Ananas comosus TaxID=4615 RepID=A0A6P5G667_ANACO|nr:pectinesterase-like [Ananas comosus]